jgi:hypothetical protein
MWIDATQHTGKITRADRSFDSSFTPEAEAMLAEVEAYLAAHLGLDEPVRKPPISERELGPDFGERLQMVHDGRPFGDSLQKFRLVSRERI